MITNVEVACALISLTIMFYGYTYNQHLTDKEIREQKDWKTYTRSPSMQFVNFNWIQAQL